MNTSDPGYLPWNAKVEHDVKIRYISSNRLSVSIVPTLIIINLGITVALASLLNVWIDEAFSLHTAGGGIGYAVRQALHFEQQPPLYFVLLNLWRGISYSPFFARLFSVLCVALTIYVVSRLSQRVLSDIHPGWVTAAAAFNPFTIWAAVEIRMYAFVLLLTTMLMLFFHDGYLADNSKRRSRWFYVACAVAGLYAHYYLGFLLAAHACVLLVLKRWRRFFNYSLDMAIVGLCFAPLVPSVVQQLHSVNMYENRASTTLSEGARIVYWDLIKYILPTGDIGWLTTARKWIMRISIIGMVIFIARHLRTVARPTYLAVWTTLAVIFAFFLAVSGSVGEEFLRIRHVAVMFVPALLTAFSLISVTKRREILVAASLVMLIFSTATLYATYKPMAKYGDEARVASYIVGAEKPGEPVIIFRAEFVLPFALYYKGKNPVVPIPAYPNLDNYDLRSQVLISEAQLNSIVSPVLSHAKRFWLITRHTDTFRGVNFHPEILEKYVNKYYTQVERKVFYKSEVRLFEEKRMLSRSEKGTR